MKFAPLFGVGAALVLAAAPLPAETMTTVVAELPPDTTASLPLPVIVGLVLALIALAAAGLVRRKLSGLNWDLLD
jgi:MYXO-CTERM domain-containing protein